MKVLVKQNPRTIALVSDTHALLFRQVGKSKVAVEIAPNHLLNTKDFKRLITKECFGFLGLINIGQNTFIAIISGSFEAAQPLPRETVNKIYSVDFLCINKNDWDFVNLDTNGYPIVSTDIDYNQQQQQRDVHPCQDLRKLLSNGTFYYSTDFDLTSLLQNRGINKNSLSYDNYSDEFMWNCFMMEEMVKFRDNLDDSGKEILDSNGFLTTVIRGFAETFQTKFNGFKSSATVISKQSWKRAGTRFNVRGIDDEGFVANFVETEFIIFCEKVIYAFAQIRGSVPIFWEQDTTLINPKVTVTRALEATQPMFDKHFQSLLEKYGMVQVVDLLSTKPSEAMLSKRYKAHVKESSVPIEFTEFDFHQETANNFANAVKILPKIQESLYELGYFSYDVVGRRVLSKQSGVFRTNCLDCLDRTNLVQQVISTAALELFMEDNQIRTSYEQDILNKHNTLWADHGDAVSQIYTGTNALKSSFSRTGKMSLAGAISDMTKSVSRIYVNNFVDKDKQVSIDTLLGRNLDQEFVKIYDPISDYVSEKLRGVEGKFTSYEDVDIFTGTFNVNATSNAEDLSHWLFPPQNEICPDIYVIGLQEIVELKAGNILRGDSSKSKYWEKTIEQQLNQNEKFLLLRSETIASLMILFFVKSSKISKVTQVSGGSKKTGMGGITANKGACAVRFNYGDSSFAMVTSHLAAGSNAVVERYNDYSTIFSGLKFPRNLKIQDHDNVIWFGDLNYRVTLPNDQARYLVEHGAFDDLLRHDQLNNEMTKGGAFNGFKEGVIKFLPTYKFDRGTDNYDTSEKQRTPSWTDRVLYTGKGLTQLNYFSAMHCYVSDHKPVYSTFKANIKVVDKEIKIQLIQALYMKYKDTHDPNITSLLESNTDESSDINSNKTLSRISTATSSVSYIDDFDKPSLPSRPSNLNLPAAKLKQVPPPPASRKANIAPMVAPRLPPRAGASTVNQLISNQDKENNSSSSLPIAPTARKTLTSQPVPIGYSSTPLLPMSRKSLSSTPNTSNNPSPVPSSRPASTPMDRPDISLEVMKPTKVAPMIPKKPVNLTSVNKVRSNLTPEANAKTDSSSGKLAPIPPAVRKISNSDMSISNWKPLTPK